MDSGEAVALMLLPLVLLFQTPADVASRLAAAERRYNGASTLQMRFEQQYRGGGQPTRVENGLLFLQKPGRMRWEYRHPEGKLFLSDGKDAWFYSPAMNQVEKSPLKTTDDWRAPLAFLMGRLDFSRDFRDFRAVAQTDAWRIAGIPKSAKSPYREVEFWVGPLGELRQVRVAGQDGATMHFHFTEEQVGGRMSADLFRFRMPPGAELVLRP